MTKKAKTVGNALSPNDLLRYIEDYNIGLSHTQLGSKYWPYSTSNKSASLTLANRLMKDGTIKPRQSTVTMRVKTGLVDGTASFEDKRRLFNKLIGKYSTLVPKPAPVRSKSRKRVVVVSDLHIPFHNMGYIVAAEQDIKHADVLIIAGDFLDIYSISRFQKDKVIDLEGEFQEGRVILERWSHMVPEIIILEGNHTERLKKVVTEKLGPGFLFLLKDGFDLLADGLTNVEVARCDLDKGDGISYFTAKHFHQIGDVVIAHFDMSGSAKTPLMGACKARDWWSGYGAHIPQLKPFKLLCQSHSHKLGLSMTSDNRMIAETGTLSLIQEYALRSDSKWAPPQPGYMTFDIDNGCVDLRSIRLVPLGDTFANGIDTKKL